jgi:glycosyltransferase involved in cell wall biosynthesis
MNTERPASEARLTLGVVIINYNYARYLRQTIESVLSQTSPFDDFCVVDDGSTDNSLQVIEPYKGRLKLIPQANGGPLTATKAGIQVLTTDYVYILDADDFISPQFVERIRPYLLSRPTKLQCQLVGVDAEGHPVGSIFPNYPPDYNAQRMIEDNETIGFYICPPTAANIYRSDYLRQIDLSGVDPLECFDGLVAMIAPYFGDVVTIAEPLAYYRLHNMNRSAVGRATLQTMTKELARFHRRWRDGCRLLGREHPPFTEDPLYVLERRLMVAGLAGESPGLSIVRAFQRRIRKTHFPRQHKVLLVCWATLFLLPSSALRQYLVTSRRTAKDRPRILKRVLQFVRPKPKLTPPQID